MFLLGQQFDQLIRQKVLGKGKVTVIDLVNNKFKTFTHFKSGSIFLTLPRIKCSNFTYVIRRQNQFKNISVIYIVVSSMRVCCYNVFILFRQRGSQIMSMTTHVIAFLLTIVILHNTMKTYTQPCCRKHIYICW